MKKLMFALVFLFSIGNLIAQDHVSVAINYVPSDCFGAEPSKSIVTLLAPDATTVLDQIVVLHDATGAVSSQTQMGSTIIWDGVLVDNNFHDVELTNLTDTTYFLTSQITNLCASGEYITGALYGYAINRVSSNNYTIVNDQNGGDVGFDFQDNGLSVYEISMDTTINDDGTQTASFNFNGELLEFDFCPDCGEDIDYTVTETTTTETIDGEDVQVCCIYQLEISPDPIKCDTLREFGLFFTKRNVDTTLNHQIICDSVFNQGIFEQVYCDTIISQIDSTNVTLYGYDANAVREAIEYAERTGAKTINLPEGDFDLSGLTPDELRKVIMVGDGNCINCDHSVKIHSERNQDQITYTDINEYNLVNFFNTINANNSAKVLFLGTSLGNYNVTGNNSDSWTNYTLEELEKQFGFADIEYYNRTIGGSDVTSYFKSTGLNSGIWNLGVNATIEDYVVAIEPDLIFMGWGMNDANTVINRQEYYNVLNSINGLNKVPSVVITNSPMRSWINPSLYNKAAQELQNDNANFLRNFANENNFGLLDFNRNFNVLRNGTDVGSQNLLGVNSLGTTTVSNVATNFDETRVSFETAFFVSGAELDNGILCVQIGADIDDRIEFDKTNGQLRIYNALNATPVYSTAISFFTAIDNIYQIRKMGSSIFIQTNFGQREIEYSHYVPSNDNLFIPTIYTKGGNIVIDNLSYNVAQSESYMPTLCDFEIYNGVTGNTTNHPSAYSSKRIYKTVVEQSFSKLGYFVNSTSNIQPANLDVSAGYGGVLNKQNNSDESISFTRDMRIVGNDIEISGAEYFNNGLSGISNFSTRGVITSTNSSATGNRSLVLSGINATASQIATLAHGNNTTASGVYSAAFNNGSTASGTAAFSANGGSAIGNGSASFNSGTNSTGVSSFSTGTFTTASGNQSFSTGLRGVASGTTSAVFGTLTQATAINAIATGDGCESNNSETYSGGTNSIANGENSFAYGLAIRSNALGSFNVGMFNELVTANSSSNYNVTDEIFVVGNGQDGNNRNNAISVTKNGVVTFDNIINLEDASTLPSSYTPVAGDIRWNLSILKHQGFDGTNWNDLY